MSDTRGMLLLQGREHDLGGFSVRRLLPHVERRSVGPFVFFDHMGPALFPPGRGIDVRPHPHIGLATVTWLFEGAIRHRDTLGSMQDIRPGAVNWMTAGRGIAHSERTPPETRIESAPLHGIQTWVALPLTDEEAAPGFHHFPAESLPCIEGEGVRLTVVAGSAHGLHAPVPVFSPTLYLAGDLPRWRIFRTRRRACGTRALRRRGRNRNRCGKPPCRQMHAGDIAGVGYRENARTRQCAGRHRGRRAAGCAAPPVVELRLVIAPAHRTGEARLGGRAVRARPRRRQGIHPAAGKLKSAVRDDRFLILRSWMNAKNRMG